MSVRGSAVPKPPVIEKFQFGPWNISTTKVLGSDVDPDSFGSVDSDSGVYNEKKSGF